MNADASGKLVREGAVTITDAQVHVWERVAIPGREHRMTPLGAAELINEMAAAGVKRAILIPPSWAGDGNGRWSTLRELTPNLSP